MNVIINKNKFIKIKQNASDIWSFFLDLIFPIECLGCGREGQWLCQTCFKKINLKAEQYCLHCKRGNDFGEFCSLCRVNYDLTGVWIASLYENKLISKAIKSLKYYFASSLADDLGKLLIFFVNNLINQGRILKPDLKAGVGWQGLNRAENLPLAILDFKANLIIPVPLAKKRWRWRGFNQAEILGKIFAGYYGLGINACDLVRIKHKKPQVKLTEKNRLSNLKDCFVWRGGSLNKRNIILLDDVVTTGATLNECARVLRANGAGEVWGLVVAKG